MMIVINTTLPRLNVDWHLKNRKCKCLHYLKRWPSFLMQFIWRFSIHSSVWHGNNFGTKYDKYCKSCAWKLNHHQNYANQVKSSVKFLLGVGKHFTFAFFFAKSQNHVYLCQSKFKTHPKKWSFIFWNLKKNISCN